MGISSWSVVIRLNDETSRPKLRATTAPHPGEVCIGICYGGDAILRLRLTSRDLCTILEQSRHGRCFVQELYGINWRMELGKLLERYRTPRQQPLGIRRRQSGWTAKRQRSA